MSNILQEDYYLNEQGLLVFTAAYHLKRGYCCGNFCLNCPYAHENIPNNLNRNNSTQPAKIIGDEKKNNLNKKLPVHLSNEGETPGFFDNVYEVVRKIPKGRVTSYGAIAHYLGAKKSARMVGWALSVSHQTKPNVPAHRVVNRVGLLSGKHHFAEAGLMEKNLLKEKVLVKDDTIVDFKNLFWDPTLELAL